MKPTLPALVLLGCTGLALASAPAPAPRLAPSVPSARPAAASPEDLRTRFETLESAGDRAGLLELWRGNRYRALFLIDTYLEGSLALREEAAANGSEVDEAAIVALHARALTGAEVAAEALGSFLILDYTAAFTGWNAEEQVLFRQGQSAFRESRTQLAAGDTDAALAAAEECLELAHSLGDWWGTGMGWTVLGQSRQASGDAAGAITAYSAARAIHESLGLLGSEYGNLSALVPLLLADGKLPRANASAERAIALVEDAGEQGMLVEALSLRLAVQEAAGDDDAAEATRAEIAIQEPETVEPGR